MTKSILTLFCVVNIALAANGVYRDSNKSIVIDTRTGLMWQDDAVGTTMNWTTAISTCEALTLGGYSDWRLPNINELASIRDMNRSTPAINAAFVNTASGGYWSSTTYSTPTTGARIVVFSAGNMVATSKTFATRYVRCVRGQ